MTDMSPEITPAMWVVIADAIDSLTDWIDNYAANPWDLRKGDDVPGALTHRAGYEVLMRAAKTAAIQSAEGHYAPGDSAGDRG